MRQLVLSKASFTITVLLVRKLHTLSSLHVKTMVLEEALDETNCLMDCLIHCLIIVFQLSCENLTTEDTFLPESSLIDFQGSKGTASITYARLSHVAHILAFFTGRNKLAHQTMQKV